MLERRLPPALKHGIRWVARRLRGRFRNGGLILLYHKVADLQCDPLGLAVSTQHFSEQMEVIRRFANPMALSDLVLAVGNNRIPRRAVAVSFDDGYLDNLTGAAPILRRQGIHATFFVTTGLIGGDEVFWWDKLAGLLPAGIAKSDVDAWQRSFQMTTEEERMAILDGMRQIAGSGQASYGSHVMSSEDLRSLHSGGGAEMGAHTVTHPMLALLGRDDCEREVRDSKRALETILDARVDAFSYPHGSCNAGVVDMVRGAGYTYACGSGSDVANAGSDPLHLPRVPVGDWDGDRFAEWLDGCFGC